MKKHNSRIVDNRATNFRMNDQIRNERNASTGTVNWPNVGCLTVVALFWLTVFYFAFKGMGIFG